MKTLNYRNWPFAVLAAFGLVLAACDSSTDPEEEHYEPEGVELVMGGQVIASYDGDTQSWTGELEVDVGEETPHISVRFVDRDGDAIPLGDDTYLEVEIEDESIAEFEQDTPGEFGGHLHGHMEGDTDVTFMLMHGAVGSGHADFVTRPVHAHVHDHDHG
ncbi:MAG: hypothetical protein OXI71_00180 [Gemmatimonadota bacterium]|nr:hypothetical protein [Gemmatimonadota bacterium]